jgi:hypothetical protein
MLWILQTSQPTRFWDRIWTRANRSGCTPWLWIFVKDWNSIVCSNHWRSVVRGVHWTWIILDWSRFFACHDLCSSICEVQFTEIIFYSATCWGHWQQLFHGMHSSLPTQVCVVRIAEEIYWRLITGWCIVWTWCESKFESVQNWSRSSTWGDGDGDLPSVLEWKIQ